ncbi:MULTISPECIES: hypothetical protein [Pseudonocardia]|uniref:hypothetical protein n=1 Tax=Pseudonocardia TaxID=1847 RepID=UPI000A27FE5D|nr:MULTISPECIES: hypothetical protein [Pseudonocardia]
MTSHEDTHGARQPPVDPARALDELEERVLGRTVDPADGDRQRDRDPAGTQDTGDTDPVEGDSGTGIDQEPPG